jgi:lipoprotein-anchoring transpeptidase ErfK/SrfK
VATVAALVPLIPIVVAIAMSSGSVPARASSGLSFLAVRSSAVAPTGAAGAGGAMVLPRGPGALNAIVRQAVPLRASPGGRVIARLPRHTEFGSPEVLWVVSHSPGWLGVISPLAGNGRVGWIPLRASTLIRNPWLLKVSLAQRRLTVLEGRRVLARYAVAIGRPDAPTPTGRFAVTDRLATGDPAGPYGCCILALSARAPHAIQGWSGGDRVAIHSTPETATIGEAVSHGCLRVTLAEGRWLLAHVPLGTPTLISSA